MQIALAQATLGDRDRAREVLDETFSDSTARATNSDYLFAKFFLAMLEDDLDAAEELLREALRNAPTLRDVDTVVKAAKHRLLLMDEEGRERREATVERAVGVAAARQRRARGRPTVGRPRAVAGV